MRSCFSRLPFDKNLTTISDGATPERDGSYIVDLNKLTPVEERDGLFFKRDDLFRPLEISALNGGKLRQIMTLLGECRAPGVITGASIHSPQIALVAGAARYMGLPSIAVAGGNRVTAELKLAMELGAKITRATSGRHRALFAEVSRLNAELKYCEIRYGMTPPNQATDFFLTQARQVANLPDRLDRVVVTCGSGISTVGIVTGLWKYSKSVGELILVATAPSRLQRISRLLGTSGRKLQIFGSLSK
jgi:1-aminocyclopropane-1-carboxylate deaminase/D-cysteine desulfhydrase-like pyridoxal-dependent ACC family enzyme